MSKRVLLIDANKKSRAVIVEMLREVEQNICVMETDDINTAYGYAMRFTVNLFISDVSLHYSVKEDTEGIIFIEHMREISKYRFTPVIFITSLEDSQLYAYRDLHCYQYIEKPYDRNRTVQVIKEALEFEVTPRNSQYILLRKDGLLYPIRKSDIIYIVFSKSKIEMQLEKNSLLFPGFPLQKMMLKLDNPCFVQCRRNIIVNLQYVESIDYVNGLAKIRNMENYLPVSETYMKKIIMDMEKGRI